MGDLVILYYHRVGVAPKSARYKNMYVLPHHLKWHLLCLKRKGYGFCTLKEALGKTEGKWCVVTFDDGYCDNLEFGFPVLSALGIPATVFVITGDVGKRQHTWEEAGDKIPSDLMTWEELRRLEWSGWEIASHASEHIHLGRKTPEKQRQALEVAQAALHVHLGHGAATFCYPYGSFAPITPGLVQQTQHQAAVTTENGSVVLPIPEKMRYTLPRLALKGQRFDHLASSFWKIFTQVP